VAIGGSGCGDDDTPGSDGGPTCVGHACPNAVIDLPEGAEVRLELIDWKDGPLEVRTHAWFASAQEPASRPWPRLPSEWGEVAPNVCVDMTSGTIWPSGNPESRTYVDVGASIKLVGGGKELVLARGMDVEDDTERNVHDIGYITEINPADVLTDTEYVVEIPGAGSIEAVTLDPGIYMPEIFVTSFPDMDETVYMPRGKDFPIIWDAPDNVDEFQFAFVAFLDLIDPTVFCIGPNNGQMVIPKDMLDVMTPGGLVKVGVLSHRAAEILDDRRADLVGINCKLTNYVVTSGF
jgi:hypothetical protein